MKYWVDHFLWPLVWTNRRYWVTQLLLAVLTLSVAVGLSILVEGPWYVGIAIGVLTGFLGQLAGVTIRRSRMRVIIEQSQVRKVFLSGLIVRDVQ